MVNFKTLFAEFSRNLGLEPHQKSFAISYGRHGGFPVLAKLVSAEKKGVVSLRARFHPGQAVPDRLRFNPDLQLLLENNRAGVGFEGNAAVLTFPEFRDRAAAKETMPAAESFLAGLAAAGLSAGEACFACGSTQEVTTVTNGKTVGQLCAACQYQQAARMADERRFNLRSVPALVRQGAVATVIIAAVWVLIWLGVDGLFHWGGGTLSLPVKLSSIVAALLGAGTALPVRLLASVEQKGDWLAGLAGLACAACGAILGEVLLNVVRLWQADLGWQLLDGARLAWATATEGSGLFLFLRGLCLAVLLLTAFVITKPSKPAFQL